MKYLFGCFIAKRDRVSIMIETSPYSESYFSNPWFTFSFIYITSFSIENR